MQVNRGSVGFHLQPWNQEQVGTGNKCTGLAAYRLEGPIGCLPRAGVGQHEHEQGQGLQRGTRQRISPRGSVQQT